MRFGVLALAALWGCANENSITVTPVESVAVTTGDFDYVAAPLDYLVVEHESYEGLISVATWSDDYDPEIVSLKVESLLGSADELALHDVVFVASGTRGLGLQQYNGLDPDDQLVSDPAVIDNVQRYVQERGGILVVTDWAYDLIAAAWPQDLQFVGDGTYDAAQVGLNGDVLATVDDPALRGALGDTANISFNFSNWAPVVSAGPNATVHLSADIEYRGDVTSGTETVAGSPLLVSFSPPGTEGKVVYAAFHFDAQHEDMMTQILTTIVGDFAADPSTTLSVGG